VPSAISFKANIPVKEEVGWQILVQLGGTKSNDSPIPDLGKLWMHQALPVHVEAFFADPKRTKLSISAQKHIRLAVKGIFETGIENKLCKENPVKKKRASTKKDTAQKSTIKYFKKEQVDKILKDAKKHRYGNYVQFPMYTGLRIGELVTIKWLDIDLKNSLITVVTASTRIEKGREEQEPKGGRVRTIGINAEFRAVLDKMPKEGTYVFEVKTNKPMSPSTYAKRYKAFFDETGNHYLSPHKCRHTYGTYMLRGGADIRSVQESLGHSSVSVTEMYTHTDTDDIKNSASKLGY
jgi:integrase